MNKLDLFENLRGISTIELITTLVSSLCVTLIFLAIFVDFMLNSTYNTQKNVKKEKKSIVETGTMTLFFVIYYIVLRIGVGRNMIFTIFSKGEDSLSSNIVFFILSIIGWFLIILGTYVNIWGRIRLGNNWANHIKIYDEHTFVQIGPYKYVRHPLYSSIILMLISGSFMYQDVFLFGLTMIVFVPMMQYRANQEEVLLKERFTDYKNYQKTVGKLCPKIKKPKITKTTITKRRK